MKYLFLVNRFIQHMCVIPLCEDHIADNVVRSVYHGDTLSDLHNLSNPSGWRRYDVADRDAARSYIVSFKREGYRVSAVGRGDF